jgi:glucose-6-phosphate-specific signal transduction histidine kinase
MSVPGFASSPSEPWFRRRPGVTVVVAVVLYAGVLALRLLLGGPQDALSLLYVLPVSLLAMAFGLRGGALAGVVAVLLMAAWVLLDDVEMSWLGWASRIVPMLLLGLLLGDASDRLRRTEAQRREMHAAARLHREAIEINDSLIQGMAAAKWSLEAGRIETGLSTLNATIEQGHQLVSGLIRDAGMGMRDGRLSESAPPPD